MTLGVGQKVRITAEGWNKYCQQTGSTDPNPGIQFIKLMPSNSPFGERVRLSAPALFWFLENEIEELKENDKFEMDGTEHIIGDPRCCQPLNSEYSKCWNCKGRMHYQPIYGGYFHECEECFVQI